VVVVVRCVLWLEREWELLKKGQVKGSLRITHPHKLADQHGSFLTGRDITV
jgi:hypothetical protein